VSDLPALVVEEGRITNPERKEVITPTLPRPLRSLGEKIRILPPLETPAPPDTHVVQVLVRARELVEKGWIQGMAQNTLGNKVCAQWAIDKANHELGFPSGFGMVAQTILLNTIQSGYGKIYPAIPVWNDQPGRTKAEVLAIYDKAISTARKVS